MKRASKCGGGAFLLLLCCAGAWFLLERPSFGPVYPYQGSSDLVATIRALPEINSTGVSGTFRDWDRYVKVARAIQVTEKSVIVDALSQFSDESANPKLQDQIKAMIVLRVCFEAPKGSKMLAPSGRHGGWNSGGAGRHYPRDMNWPVARAIGRFYVVELISGYRGTYLWDPVSEFRWFEANGKKRKL